MHLNCRGAGRSWDGRLVHRCSRAQCWMGMRAWLDVPPVHSRPDARRRAEQGGRLARTSGGRGAVQSGGDSFHSLSPPLLLRLALLQKFQAGSASALQLTPYLDQRRLTRVSRLSSLLTVWTDEAWLQEHGTDSITGAAKPGATTDEAMETS